MTHYAIIVVPPPEIIERVDRYRKQYARYTDYIIIPHLTIYPSFYITSGNEQDIIRILKKSFRGTSIGTVNLSGMGYFVGGNNVAFFNPDIESSDYLKSLLIKATEILKGKIKNVHDDGYFLPENFRPHMTIAEKVPAEIFKSVKKELDEVAERSSFTVSSVFLYERTEDSNLWNEVAEIDF